METNENLKKLRNFFSSNLDIKKMIYAACPDDDYRFSQEYAFDCYDKMEKTVKRLHSMFKTILKDFDYNEDITAYVDKLFEGYQLTLDSAGYDFNKLGLFYDQAFSSMNEKLVTKVYETCFGDGMTDMYRGLVTKATSVNELLHVIHANIMNDEKIYRQMPVVAERSNENGEQELN